MARKAPPPPPLPKKRRRRRTKAERSVEDEERRKRQEVYQISVTAAAHAAAFRGYLVYVQNPGLTMRQVWENFRIDENEEGSAWIRESISWEAFRARAKKDKWVDRRDEFWAQVEGRMMAALQTDMVRRELEEVPRLDLAGDRLMLHIVGGLDSNGQPVTPAVPKSLEGAVKAMIDLDKYRSGKRERITEWTAAQASATGAEDGYQGTPLAGHPVEDELSDDELVEYTRRLVAARAGLAINAEEVDERPVGLIEEAEGAAAAEEAGEE